MYEHGADNTLTDTLKFTVEDPTGMSSYDITMTIQVSSVTVTAPRGVDFERDVNRGQDVTVLFADAVSGTDTRQIITDPDGGTVFTGLVIGTPPDYSSSDVTLNTAGTGITYAHDTDEAATSDWFTFTVLDAGNERTNVINASFSINQPPVGNDFERRLTEGSSPTIRFNSGSNVPGQPILSDPEGERAFRNLEFLVKPQGNLSEVTLAAGGTAIRYAENRDDDIIRDEFTFTVEDSKGATSNPITVVIHTKTGPEGSDFERTIGKGDTLQILFADHVSDTDDTPILNDPNGFAVFTSFETRLGPEHGTVTLDTDGLGMTYVHGGGTETSDTFEFRARDSDDGFRSDYATATINIEQPPVGNDFEFSVTRGGDRFVRFDADSGNGQPRVNDPDGDRSFKNLVFIEKPTNNLTDVELHSSGFGLVYEHNDSDTTSDRFVFKVEDPTGRESNEITATVVINHHPIGSDFAANVAKGRLTTILFIEDSSTPGMPIISDRNGGTFQNLNVTSGPQNNSTVVVLNEAGTGIEYVHNNNEETTDEFKFTVEDSTGLESNEVTATLGVVANQRPTGTDFGRTIDKGATLNFLLTDPVSDTDDTPILVDPDGNLPFQNIEITTSAGHGTATAKDDGTGITYVHDNLGAGSDVFVFTVQDSLGTASNPITATITIRQAPIGNDFAFAVDRDERITIPFSTDDGSGPIVSDPNENDDFQDLIIKEPGPQRNSSNIILSPGGTGIIYEHNDGDHTIDTFTFSVGDDTGLRTGDIVASVTINQPPVGSDFGFTVVNGSSKAIQFHIDTAANGNQIVDDPNGNTDYENIILTDIPDNNKTAITLNAAGDGFTYTHDGSATITDEFTFRVQDDTGLRSGDITASVTISQPPTGNDFAFIVNASGTITIPFGTGDDGGPIFSDLNGDTTFQNLAVKSGPQHNSGDVVLGGGGTGITYTHDGGDHTSDEFTFTVQDSTSLESAEVTATITINQAPVGNEFSAVAGKGLATTILFAEAVSETDSTPILSDPNGDTEFRNLIITDGPTHNTGDVILNDDGTGIIYTHDDGISTSDEFSFTVVDSGGLTSSEVTAFLSITDDLPPVGYETTSTIRVGETVTVLFSATSDNGINPFLSDPNGDTTFDTFVRTAGPASGNAALNDDGTGVEYTHTGTTTGTDEVTFTVQDATSRPSNEVTLKINIVANKAPVGIANFERAVNASGTITILYGEPSAGASSDPIVNDPEGDDLKNPQAVSGPSGGTITATTEAVPGSTTETRHTGFTYTHGGTAETSDTYQFTIDDDLGDTSNAITATFMINQAPVGSDFELTVTNGSSTSIQFDVDTATNGSPIISDPNGNIDYQNIRFTDTPDNNKTAIMLNAAGDGFTYTHDGSATATDSFTFTVDDPGGLGSGDITASVIINQPPTGNDFGFSVNASSTITIPFDTDDGDGPIVSDLNGDTTFLNLDVKSGPQHNSTDIVLGGGGTGITYAHDGGDHISDEFTFTVRDTTNFESNRVTATITINQPPVGNDFAAVVVKGETATILFASESTPGGSPIVNDLNGNTNFQDLIIETGPDHNSTAITLNLDGTGLVYAHDGGTGTSDVFTFRVGDATGLRSGTITATLTITSNLPAVGTDFERTIDRGATLGVLFTDPVSDTDSTLILVDPEDDTPFGTLAASDPPDHGTLELDNTGTGITYEHGGGGDVLDAFTFTVTDSEGTVSNPVTGTITINQAPVGTNFTRTINHTGTVEILFTEDGKTVGTPILNDPNGDLTFDGFALATQASHGTVTAKADGTGITYVHGGTAAVSDAFSFTMEDATDKTSNIINATIIINQPPVGSSFAAEANRGATTTILFATESSPGGDPIVSDLNGNTDFQDLIIESSPQYNSTSITLNSDRTGLVYAHNGSTEDSDEFTFRVGDATGLRSGIITATLAIADNNPPVGHDARRTIEAGQRIFLAFSTVVDTDFNKFVSDPDGDTVFQAFVIKSAPQHGTAELADGGRGVSYTHTGSTGGTDQFTFTVDDSTGLTSNEVTLFLNINPNNPPVVRSTITRNVDQGGTVEARLDDTHRIGGDPDTSERIVQDADGDMFKDPILTTSPSLGTVEFFNGTGANAGFTVGFRYAHGGSGTANDVFAFSIADEHGLRSVGDVTVTITVGGSELIQVQDHDFSVLKGGRAEIPLTSWITLDPSGDGDYVAIEFLVEAEHADVDINRAFLETLIYDHNDSDEMTDTFTFRVTNDAGIQTGYVTSVVTILPDLMGNDFNRTVYNQGGDITILFNETSTSGRPILDDYGLVTFQDIEFSNKPEYNLTDVVLNGDGTGFRYVHNGSGGTQNTVDTFTFTVEGAGDNGDDYTSNEITATIETIAPRAPTADNSTRTASSSPDDPTTILLEEILYDPNIDPNSDDPIVVGTVSIVERGEYGRAEVIDDGGTPPVPTKIEYTPYENATGADADLIVFVIIDEAGIESPPIGFRLEFGASGGGGGDDDQQWKRKPTFGESHLTGALIVENGFSFNGNRLDVTNNWHTDFAKTSSIIGEQNTVMIKTYANDPLRRVSLSLAIPEVGALHDAETDIHVILQRNYSDASGYNIVDIIHEQKEHLVNATHTTASIGPAKCTSTSEDERCYEVEISFVVTAPLKHDVVAITAVDSKRYSTTTYINDGVVFEGDALLPAHTHQMTQKRGNQHPAETIQLTQQDRRFELWEDQHGFLWTKNTHGTWMRLTHPDFERPDDPDMTVKTRLHSDFAGMIQDERDRALLVFNASAISSEPEEPFTYEYYLRPSKLSDPEILEQMRIQSELAESKYGGN